MIALHRLYEITFVDVLLIAGSAALAKKLWDVYQEDKVLKKYGQKGSGVDWDSLTQNSADILSGHSLFRKEGK